MNRKLTEIFSQKSNKSLIIPITAAIVLIDQISKIIIRSNLALKDSIILIPDTFNLTHTENTGAAFSLFSGHVEILTLISIIAAIAIILYFLLNHNDFSLIQLSSWGFLLGGTLGNLIDRLLFGKVTDFLDFTLINFPIFNFADMFIDIGAFIIIVLNLIEKKHEQKK